MVGEDCTSVLFICEALKQLVLLVCLHISHVQYYIYITQKKQMYTPAFQPVVYACTKTLSVWLGPTGNGETFMTVYGLDAHSLTTRQWKASKTTQSYKD